MALARTAAFESISLLCFREKFMQDAKKQSLLRNMTPGGGSIFPRRFPSLCARQCNSASRPQAPLKIEGHRLAYGCVRFKALLQVLWSTDVERAAAGGF